MLDDDDALEGIWKKESSLSEFVAPEQFKTYDELKKRLGYVLGNSATIRRDAESFEEDDDRGEAEELVNAAVSTTPSSVNEDEDDALSYFAKLAE